MTGWQPSQYDPGQQPGSPAPQAAGQQPTQQYGQPQPQYGQVQPYQAPAYPASQPAAYPGRRPVTGLTAWQQFWYILQCIYFGAGYFAKIPAKKALSDYGMVEMTGAEKFWYVLQCLAFGAGYFAKLPTAKALSEMPQFRAGAYR